MTAASVTPADGYDERSPHYAGWRVVALQPYGGAWLNSTAQPSG